MGPSPGARALDVFGAAATFGLVMVLTQHEIAAIDGQLRSALTMALVAVLALVITQAQGGMRLPHTSPGWWGLAMPTLLFGTAFTVMYTLLPRLGVVGTVMVLGLRKR